MSYAPGMRLALLLLVIAGLGTADAQVFKPKGKAPAAEKKTTKASPKKSKATRKKSPKKSAAADRGRPADLTPEGGSRDSDSDFVKITDDDEIE